MRLTEVCQLQETNPDDKLRSKQASFEEMIEVEQPTPPNLTFDEASLERSKSFVKALQELKSLRPQLYSAAEYCEKSYLHSEQKQMLLDNLKDYAVRALVNAVDHLGTVAYKLTDLLEQQTLEVSTIEFDMSRLKQRLLTCQTYTDKEGLRQQQLLAFIPRYHKHYVLPNSVNKKVHFGPLVQSDARQTHFARSRLRPSGGPAAKTLLWHLASETKPSLKGTSHSLTSSNEDPKTSGTQTAVFQLVDKVDDAPKKSSGVPAHLSTGGHPSSGFKQTFGLPNREMLESSKPLTAFRSFDTPRREAVRAPARSKSMLSAFFAKQKRQS